MDGYNAFAEQCMKTDVLEESLLNDLKDFSQYNSMGTLNWTVDLVTILRDRIAAGQQIRYKDEPLTEQQFRTIVKENFGSYVYRGVFGKGKQANQVYFKLENTEEGMELVYTGDTENDVFVKIADLNANESIVRLIPNNVVYIYNQKTGNFTPFLTEHNSCYVYDETDGKIKEFFE